MKALFILPVLLFLIGAAFAACPSGKVQNLAGNCVDCLTNSNCQDTAQTPYCNFMSYTCVECRTVSECPTDLEEWTGTRVCRGDAVREVGYEKEPSACSTSGICSYTRGEEMTRLVQNCALIGQLCYNGTCGCPDGEINCNGECVPEGAKNLGQNCTCDGECNDGICYNKECKKVFGIAIKENQTNQFVNQTFELNITFANFLDEISNVKLNISTDKGEFETEICEKKYCSEELELQPNSSFNYSVAIIQNQKENVTLKINSTLADGHQFLTIEEIEFHQCGDSICGIIEANATCCQDCGALQGYECVNNTNNFICGDGLCVAGESCENCCTDCGCGNWTQLFYKECNENLCELKIGWKYWIPFLIPFPLIILVYFLRKQLHRILSLLKRGKIKPSQIIQDIKQKEEDVILEQIEKTRRNMKKMKKQYSEGVMWHEYVRKRRKE